MKGYGRFSMAISALLGKTAAKSSYNLFVGVVSQNIILAVSAVIVGRLLGSALYGIFTLSSVPANFVGLFVGLGIRSAVTRYAANYSHQNQQKKLKETIITAISFTILIGILLSIICFSISYSIAVVFGRPDSAFLVQLLSLTIFSNGLIVALQSVFVGVDRTEFYSLLLVLRAIVQVFLGPFLILGVWNPAGFGALGAVVGYVIASFTSCLVGLAICYFALIRKYGPPLADLELLSSLKTQLRFGFPLYISRIVGGFLTQLLSLFMAIYASDTSIGNYRVSQNFTILISFFAIPIATVLFPAFSKLDRDDSATLETVFRASVKYTSLLIMPATALVIALSKPLVGTLYGTTYESAPFFLSLSGLTFLYSVLGQFSINGILNGQGETKKNMLLSLSNVAVGLPLAFFLVPRFQILGLIVVNVISMFPGLVLGSVWVKRLYDVAIDWQVASKIFIVSSAAGLLAWCLINFISLPNWMQLVSGSAVLVSVMILLMPVTGVVNSEDIQNIHTIFSEIGTASVIIHIPLKIMQKLCR